MRRSIPALCVLFALTACGSDDGGGQASNGGAASGSGGASGGKKGGGGGNGGSGGSLPPAYDDVNELVADATLAIPKPGTLELRVISPRVLEIRAITTKDPDPAGLSTWNFVQSGALSLPSKDVLGVTSDGAAVSIENLGFRRRVLYAPLEPRDLRIDNRLMVELATPLADGAQVKVVDSSNTLFPAEPSLSATADGLRTGPAIHVNQVGYLVGLPKKARVGYWLGSLGELPQPSELTFELVRTKDSSVAFAGTLAPHPEDPDGFLGHPYQALLEADFSSFDEKGNYRLRVPGLGASFPFWIGDGAAAAFARTYALGLYHQRCGQASALPYTRFERGACHTAAARIPTMTTEFDKTNTLIGNTAKDFTDQSAPIVMNVDASLYPIQKTGTIDVSGGHHDAGDYSKYVINSALLIHHLVFAADAFPGVAELDNLGIPESGDGKSDVLYEAKYEADFLAKMQDSDGGFFTLVYPKDRAYENDVTPDHGDPQVVWPKSTAVTAAAVAALAEIGSSPRFRSEYSAAAGDAFVGKAKLGWQFLEQAVAKYGKDGSFQVVYHYGHDFHNDDEFAWAAAALFAATGESKYSDALKTWFPDPSDPATFQWSWWRMFAGYGCAIRTYAFAARTGRRTAAELDAGYLTKCEQQIALSGDDQRRWAAMDAYGSSFPDISKHYFATGWYFSSDRAFDATVAYQLDPKAELLETVISNMNFEAGQNPVNVSYLTGIGWRRQREIVSQQAENDREVLPPSGIVIGNAMAGFPWLDLYGSELNALSFPGDDAPIYDRWGDTFNVTTEAVSLNLARSLASLAFLMTQTGAKDSAGTPLSASIVAPTSALQAGQKQTISVEVTGGTSGARIVWEAQGIEPVFGPTLEFTPSEAGTHWVEAEAQWPDGRRAFARGELSVSP